MKTEILSVEADDGDELSIKAMPRVDRIGDERHQFYYRCFYGLHRVVCAFVPSRCEAPCHPRPHTQFCLL